MMSRRTLMAGTAAAPAGCVKPRTKPVTQLVHRPLASLPRTELPWLTLRDHFVATVGQHAGSGTPLGSLLVLADATFAPHSRFPLHPHKQMEILSIVLDGTLSHHGDQAYGSTLGPRGAQLISARDGMMHAEGNDTDMPTRMLQLWFKPDARGGPPAYFTRQLAGTRRELVAGDATMPLRVDARVWWLRVPAGESERVDVMGGRSGYLMAIKGPMRIAAPDGGPVATLVTGEGAALGDGPLDITTDQGCEVLWVDIPKA